MPEASTGPGGDGRPLSFAVTQSAQRWSAASSPQALRKTPVSHPGRRGTQGSQPGPPAGHCLPFRKPMWCAEP